MSYLMKLEAKDLEDFISPGPVCIKPVETPNSDKRKDLEV